jgi:HlyD family secretion protein
MAAAAVSIRAHLRVALAATLVLAAGVAAWARFAELGGAVAAAGSVVVETTTKKVQHPTGGVVREVLVRDGEHVTGGQVVVRLDATQAQANLNIYEALLDRLEAQLARDEAEIAGLPEIAFPASLLARQGERRVAAELAAQRKQFRDRTEARAGKIALLREEVAQLREEAGGDEAQIKALTQQLALIDQEATGVRALWQQKLVPFTTLNKLDRDRTILDGQRAQVQAAVAQVRGKISETELKALQVDADNRTEVGKERSELEAQIAEATEKKVSAKDQLSRVDIRAPANGFVQALAVNIEGEVVKAGDPLMLIVPEQDALVVEAKVLAQDIDEVSWNAPAAVRFSAFPSRTTPELNGTVSVVAADASDDQRTGAHYYTVRVAVPESEIARLGNATLKAGMPAEVSLYKRPVSAWAMVARPFGDALHRAFRER